MRVTRLAVVSAAIVLFSAGAFAAETQTASANAAPKDKLICKALVHEGMAVPTAVQCHTQHYWDEVRWGQQQAIMDLQLHAALHHGH
jgi:hypothetical protein